MLSCKHSCIPGAYHCKHLLIPCPTNDVVGHILRRMSNKHIPASLDQGANWFGAPATNVRRVSEANRIFNRTNPPIVAKIKDCKIARMQNLHNFRTIGSVFSDTRLRYKLSIIDTRLSRNGYGRALVTLRAPALALLETTLPVKKTLAQFMSYEQLFICRLSNLPPPIVSIVLRKLAIVNTSSRKQEWTFVHSVVVHLIYKKFN